MSIRILAQELYRAQKKVEELRRGLSGAQQSEDERCAQELREAEREMKTLQKMFDNKKDSGSSNPRGRR
jgi:predicted RNase H-like nuclease (RuvC/YqgF family)